METRSSPLRIRIAIGLVSLVCSLGLAEGAAHVMRGGAFPYLNLFEANADYGVSLSPSAHTRTRSRTGTLTDVRTNALGFRGREWTPAPSAAPVVNRVLLVGDSQAFGYGVDVEHTLARALEREIGPNAEVLNAAVPTWGPTEYAAVIEELAPRFRPTQVVFVANAANDWFEANVPNRRRTTAADGWATRVRVSRTEPSPFPGRRFLFGQSHLVFMLREVAAAARSGIPPAHAAEILRRDVAKLRRPRSNGDRSVVTPHLRRAVETCRRYGCTVTAVALPLDVQVHAGEWEKYRSPRADLTSTLSLLTDFVADARTLGVTAIDLTSTLVESSPGAFLGDDYHLSPTGHAALARTIASAIASPATQKRKRAAGRPHRQTAGASG